MFRKTMQHMLIQQLWDANGNQMQTINETSPNRLHKSTQRELNSACNCVVVVFVVVIVAVNRPCVYRTTPKLRS